MFNKDTVKFAFLLSVFLVLWGLGFSIAIFAAMVVITYYYVKQGTVFFAYGGGAVFLASLIISGFSLISAFCCAYIFYPCPFYWTGIPSKTVAKNYYYVRRIGQSFSQCIIFRY